MTKSILISIRPEHAVKILNGEKTLELRKSAPKDFTGWVYIYVTKSSKYSLVDILTYGFQLVSRGLILADTGMIANLTGEYLPFKKMSGKVVARFWFDDYETFDSTKGNPKIYVKACVDDKHAYNYLKGKTGYAWHIDNLVIFDKPKDLWDFHTRHDMLFLGRAMARKVFQFESVYKAPQSWMYVYVKGVSK